MDWARSSAASSLALAERAADRTVGVNRSTRSDHARSSFCSHAMIKHKSSACMSSMKAEMSALFVFGSARSRYFSTAAAIRGANTAGFTARESVARARSLWVPSASSCSNWWLLDSKLGSLNAANRIRFVVNATCYLDVSKPVELPHLNDTKVVSDTTGFSRVEFQLLSYPHAPPAPRTPPASAAWSFNF